MPDIYTYLFSIFSGMKESIAATDSFNTDNIKENPAHIRIKRLQYATMLKMFSDIMEDYNASLLRYHDKCLQLLQQQRMLIKKHTANEIDEPDSVHENNIFVDNVSIHNIILQTMFVCFKSYK